MIIIETCPKCGHDLIDEIIDTYPPIPRKVCFNCGWSWTGEREEVIRVPFGGNSMNFDSPIDLLQDYTTLNISNLEDSIVDEFKKSACISCPNNTKNGGSGICHCILGQQEISY